MHDVGLPARVQADLLAARKARDEVATSALRGLLAALSNAEAPPADHLSPLGTVGIVEHERLELGAGDHARILAAEVQLRRDGIAEYEAVSQTAAADRLRAEIAVLERYLP